MKEVPVEIDAFDVQKVASQKQVKVKELQMSDEKAKKWVRRFAVPMGVGASDAKNTEDAAPATGAAVPADGASAFQEAVDAVAAQAIGATDSCCSNRGTCHCAANVNADPAPRVEYEPIEIEENYYPASSIKEVDVNVDVMGVVTQHIPIKKTVMQQMPQTIYTPRRVMVPMTTMEAVEVEEPVEIIRKVKRQVPVQKEVAEKYWDDE